MTGIPEDADNFDLIEEATTYDVGGLDIHLLEIETEYGPRYWITTTPSFYDAMTYDMRDNLGRDIYEAISQHESWDQEISQENETDGD